MCILRARTDWDTVTRCEHPLGEERGDDDRQAGSAMTKADSAGAGANAGRYCYAALLRRRRKLASPAKPTPSTASEAGSGTL